MRKSALPWPVMPWKKNYGLYNYRYGSFLRNIFYNDENIMISKNFTYHYARVINILI